MNIFIKQIRNIIRMAHSATAADAARKQMPLTKQAPDPTPEQTALIEAIEALPRQQQIELQAVMSLGRGDFDHFRKALRHSEQNPEHLSTYITAKAPLADYLSHGLKKLPKRAYTYVNVQLRRHKNLQAAARP